MIKDSSSSEEMISGIKDTNGVYLVPAFVGLGAPYWNSQARGIIAGLTAGRMRGISCVPPWNPWPIRPRKCLI